MRVLSVTRGAWSSAVGLVRERLAADGVEADGAHLLVGPGGTDADAELSELGITGAGGELAPEWAAAIGQHLLAPVRATLRAASGSVGGRTRFTLVEDRVLLVADAVRGEPGARELEVTDVATHVDVVLVRVDDLWPTVARTLPPLEQLTAGADRAAGSSSGAPRTVLDVEDAARMRSGQDLTALPAAARALVQDEQATLSVVVEAWPTPAAPTVVWTRWWSVAGGRLLDVQRRDDTVELVERPPGSVAAELRWALVGAIDATTPAADGTVRTEEGAR